MKPHKHAELIKAWADGYTIQYKDGYGWWDWDYPDWDGDDEYRIKPETKPDVVKTICVMNCAGDGVFMCEGFHEIPNLKLTFDGETGKLKSAEVLC
jgi:hypothetical protein